MQNLKCLEQMTENVRMCGKCHFESTQKLQLLKRIQEMAETQCDSYCKPEITSLLKSQQSIISLESFPPHYSDGSPTLVLASEYPTATIYHSVVGFSSFFSFDFLVLRFLILFLHLSPSFLHVPISF